MSKLGSTEADPTDTRAATLGVKTVSHDFSSDLLPAQDDVVWFRPADGEHHGGDAPGDIARNRESLRGILDTIF